MVGSAFWRVEPCWKFHTIESGCILQRLFSTFPDSWPGFGLLLQRLGVGVTLIYLGVSSFFGTAAGPITVARDFIEGVGGIFLLAGLWTPVTGVLIAANELWIAFSLNSSQQDGSLIHIFLTVLTAGVAMLGPGVWSIDARLFGRKRFKMADRARGGRSSLQRGIGLATIEGSDQERSGDAPRRD